MKISNIQNKGERHESKQGASKIKVRDIVMSHEVNLYPISLKAKLSIDGGPQ